MLGHMEIYNLRSNSRSKLDLDMPQCYGTNIGASVYINGVCHWSNNDNDKPILVSFDLNNKVSGTTLMSSDVNDDFNIVFVIGYFCNKVLDGIKSFY